MKKIFSVILILFVVSAMVCCHFKTNDELSKYNLAGQDIVIDVCSSVEEVFSLTQSNVTFLYLGKPDCPWCQMYLPYFNQTAFNHGRRILYFNAESIKHYDILSSPETPILINPSYQRLLDWINQNNDAIDKKYLKYKTIQIDDIRSTDILWLYVPRLFKIVDGQIVDCVRPLEDHILIQDANGLTYLPSLSEQQYQKLQQKLDKFFDV